MNSVEQLETQQCRTCYNSLSDLQLLTTFPASCSGQVEMKTYATLLNEVCNINVMEDTGIWPQFICSACSQKLLTAYDFIQQTVKTDKHLRSITNRMQIKNEIDFIEKPELDIPLEVKIEEFDTGNEREFQYSPIEQQLIKSELIMTTDQQHEDTKNTATEQKDANNTELNVTNYSQSTIKNSDNSHCDDIKNECIPQSNSKQNYPNSPNSLTCNECYRSFKSVSKLKRHKGFFHVKKIKNKISCPHCDLKFPRFTTLREHLRTEHGIPNKVFTCEQCQRTYAAKCKLTRHNDRMHKKEGNEYLCCQCGTKFERLDYFNTHMQKMHGTQRSDVRKKKLFRCDKCNYSTLRRCRLKKHEKERHTEVPENKPNF